MCSVMTRVLTLVGLAACSDPAARVALAPIDLGACGKPLANTIVRVIAYTSTGDIRRTDPVISDFPATTEQLGVEVVSGGVVVSTGKTASLAYNELANGTQIPIAMVPLDGFCPVSAMTVARIEPLVAHAGQGVLVLGGEPVDGTGVSPPSAEYYDPATAQFTAVALPTALQDGNSLVGAATAELADGRVAVSSGQALTVFDPVAMTFSQPVFVEARSEHAAFGLDGCHILVTGGCQSNGGSTCGTGSTVRRSTVEYQLDASGHTVGDGVAKPPLPATSVRFGGRLFDVGITSDGNRRLVLAGATSDPWTADQLPLSETDTGAFTTTVAHLFSQVTELDGGALLTAFDPDGTAVPTSVASIVPPEGGDGLDVALPPAITGARLITLEDGTAVAIGGDAGFSRYTPTTNTWAQLAPPVDQVANWPGAIAAPSLIRLRDGTVLVLGGGSSAWLYRPSLDGPTSGHVERPGRRVYPGRDHESNLPAIAAFSAIACIEWPTIPTTGRDRSAPGQRAGLKRDLPARAAVLAALIPSAGRAVGRTAIGGDFSCHNGLSSENRDRTAHVAVCLAVTGRAAVRGSAIRRAAR